LSNMDRQQELDYVLLEAAYHGDLELLKEMLKEGASVDTKDKSGYTPLHWVCFKGMVGENRAEMAEILIEAGADVNSALPIYGPSIISTACGIGNLDIVKLLVEHGVDVNDDLDGSTPLIQAIHGGNVELVEYLLAHGAIVDKSDINGKTPMKIAVAVERPEMVAILEKHL